MVLLQSIDRRLMAIQYYLVVLDEFVGCDAGARVDGLVSPLDAVQ